MTDILVFCYCCSLVWCRCMTSRQWIISCIFIFNYSSWQHTDATTVCGRRTQSGPEGCSVGLVARYFVFRLLMRAGRRTRSVPPTGTRPPTTTPVPISAISSSVAAAEIDCAEWDWPAWRRQRPGHDEEAISSRSRTSRRRIHLEYDILFVALCWPASWLTIITDVERASW